MNFTPCVSIFCQLHVKEYYFLDRKKRSLQRVFWHAAAVVFCELAIAFEYKQTFCPSKYGFSFIAAKINYGGVIIWI